MYLSSPHVCTPFQKRSDRWSLMQRSSSTSLDSCFFHIVSVWNWLRFICNFEYRLGSKLFSDERQTQYASCLAFTNTVACKGEGVCCIGSFNMWIYANTTWRYAFAVQPCPERLGKEVATMLATAYLWSYNDPCLLISKFGPYLNIGIFFLLFSWFWFAQSFQWLSHCNNVFPIGLEDGNQV